MIRKIAATLCLLLLGSTAMFAEIKLRGSIRNDVIIQHQTNTPATFSDILENQLVLTFKAEKWKFYSDIRLQFYFGAITNMLGTTYNINPLRSFIRFYTDIGDFSVGQTYFNFGNPGLFNPFEMDKGINMTDLNYAKSGLLALTHDIPFGDVSGMKWYIAPQMDLTNTGAGFSLFTTLGSFDLGIVYNRKKYNENVTGIFFKGDLELGVHGAYALHVDDYGTFFNEANLGIDYSFFDGKLILNLIFYYDELGAEHATNYNPFSTADKYYLAKYYLYANATAVFDEFFSAQFDAFFNLIDGSGILIPGIKYQIADGLYTSLLGYIVIGDGGAEYSRDVMGDFSLFARIEGKL